MPGKTVGYRVGGESKRGQHIEFCTVGYLNQLLSNNPAELGSYTHVVLDEVHERTLENDMLCLLVRLLMTYAFRNIRMVIMSAMLEGYKFVSYFTSALGGWAAPKSIYVKGRCFPVITYWLEEVVDAFGDNLELCRRTTRLIHEMFVKRKKPWVVHPQHADMFCDIIVDLIRGLAQSGATTLVFLPGIAEIALVWNAASRFWKTAAG